MFSAAVWLFAGDRVPVHEKVFLFMRAFYLGFKVCWLRGSPLFAHWLSSARVRMAEDIN